MKKYIGIIIILTLINTCVYSQFAEYTSNELLVKMKPRKTSIQKANLKSQMNAHAIKTLPQTDVEVWQLDNSQDVQQVVAQYRYHPDIEFVEPNYIYSIHTNNPNDPDYDKLWELHNTGQNGGTSDVDVDAPEAWNITTGSPSIAVAIIDTGIDWKHEDLAENIWQNLAEDADGDGRVLEWLNGEWVFDPGDENGIDDDGNGYIDDFIGWDFANDDNDPSDGNSHGTHVAGILGAKGNNNIGITGITQNVQLVALKYLDDEGFGYADDAVAALNYAVDMGIPISNNSWGGGGYSTPFYQALRNAEINGHIFVAAAGNSGDNNDAFPTFPASYDVENVISVANIDRNDALNPTSNFGINSVHIAAPGTQIWSCLPLNGYGYKSGTSMAAPLVAGACALLWEEYADRSYSEIKGAILNSATQTDVLEDKCLSEGRLNVNAALNNLIPPIPPSACYLQDSATVRNVYMALMGEEVFSALYWERPFDTWEGITFSEEGCVKDINTAFLPEGYISPPPYNEFIPAWAGFIHPDIVNLSELESLALVHRNEYFAPEVFDGVVPGFLAELPKLEYLKVKTWYNTPIMQAQTTGWNLRHLDLSDSRVTNGTFPTEFGNLPNLEWLDLNDNQLTQIPDFIYDLDSLQLLFLDNNEISGCYDEAMFSLCSSVYLSINGNDMDATWIEFCNYGTISCSFPAPCRYQDSLNLAAIYHATNGANWLNSWNLNQPVDTWHGVGFNAEGCIDSLNLSGNQLSGNIPVQIGDLGNLMSLNLSNNQLTGNIPPEISNLTALQYLHLNNNQLIGNIPSEFGQLNQLQSLRLSNNQLTGCYAYDLVQLCNLLPNSTNTDISLGNDFNATWETFCTNQSGVCGSFTACRQNDSLALVSIYNETNGANWLNTWNLNDPINEWHGVWLNPDGCVYKLDLSENQLAGSIPSQITDLTQLKYLYLNDNQLTGGIPAELIQLDKLQELNLSNNELSGCYDIELEGLCPIIPSSSHISAGNDFIANWSAFCYNEYGLCGGYESCRQSDSLALVDFYHQTDGINWLNQWDFNTPLELWEGVTLTIDGCIRDIRLPNNQLSGTIPTIIGNLSELRQLNLSNNNLTGEIPIEIADLTQLAIFYVGKNNLTGEIPIEIGNLNKLEIFHVGFNNLIGNIPHELGSNLLLDNLSLYNNQFTGNIPASIGDLPNLTYLNVRENQLSGCFHIELQKLHDRLFVAEDDFASWCFDDGNNFDVNWLDFVYDDDGICDPLWAGDFNADGKVDKSDVLYWGLAEGNAGSPRPNPSITWTPQYASDWQQSVNGINSKHQDGNGDGIVDAQDLDVLLANYRKTHTFNPQNYIASGIEYRLEPISDTTDAGNVILRYALYAEESGAPANVHGITCSIDFGELPAGNITIDTTGSSLQPQQQVGIFDAVENRLDLALTRTDKQNTLCNGPVVVVQAIVAMKDLPSGETFAVQVNNNGSMMEANGTVNAASGMTVYDVFSFNNSEMLLTATATHAECGTLGKAEISITGGVAPYSIWWNTGETTQEITNLTPEKYTATVTDAIGNEKTIEVEIQGRYIPSYDEDGNVLDCNIIAARIQPELCVLLEGAYSDSTGLMSSSLLSLDVLPNGQPYHESTWNYNGTEGLNWTAEDYPIGMIDWLLVSFRTQATADTQVGEVAAILMEDGCLHFTSDYLSLTQNVDSLYVVLKHRNHAAVMTPYPIALTGDVLTYDFRANDSYRNPTSSGQKQLSDGNWAMYAGDCDQSDANGYDINGQDKNPWVSLNGTFGNYAIPDLNLDGDVNGADKILWFMNNGISSIVPK